MIAFLIVSGFRQENVADPTGGKIGKIDVDVVADRQIVGARRQAAGRRRGRVGSGRVGIGNFLVDHGGHLSDHKALVNQRFDRDEGRLEEDICSPGVNSSDVGSPSD